jgi:hypothetical protein
LSRNTIRRTTVPTGEPVGTVAVGTDDAGQITLLLSDDNGEALEAALSLRQASALAWQLLSLAEPKSAAAMEAKNGA